MLDDDEDDPSSRYGVDWVFMDGEVEEKEGEEEEEEEEEVVAAAISTRLPGGSVVVVVGGGGGGGVGGGEGILHAYFASPRPPFPPGLYTGTGRKAANGSAAARRGDEPRPPPPPPPRFSKKSKVRTRNTTTHRWRRWCITLAGIL